MAGQIVAKGERTWLVRVFLGRDGAGKRTYFNELVHGTKKDAQKRLNKLLSDRDEGSLVVAPKGTLDEYLDLWLETTVRPSVRQRTHSDYTAVLERYVRPHLGAAKLARITPLEVRGMLAKLRALGLGPRSVRQAHEVLRNALEQAAADRLIRDNPARSRLVKKALPQKARSERVTIQADDVAAFLDVARGDGRFALWMVLLFGGLRPEEALALTWDDVNGNVVSVRRVLVDKPGKQGLPLHFEAPKSESSRRAVVVPDIVLQALQEHRRAQAAARLAAGPAWEDGGLIFCTPTGTAMRQDKVRRALRRILQAAELPPMRLYDLRHSCASLLLEMGIGLKVVSERLGHSSIQLTGDTYAHVSPGMQQEAADALERIATP